VHETFHSLDASNSLRGRVPKIINSSKGPFLKLKKVVLWCTGTTHVYHTGVHHMYCSENVRCVLHLCIQFTVKRHNLYLVYIYMIIYFSFFRLLLLTYVHKWHMVPRVSCTRDSTVKRKIRKVLVDLIQDLIVANFVRACNICPSFHPNTTQIDRALDHLQATQTDTKHLKKQKKRKKRKGKRKKGSVSTGANSSGGGGNNSCCTCMYVCGTHIYTHIHTCS